MIISKRGTQSWKIRLLSLETAFSNFAGLPNVISVSLLADQLESGAGAPSSVILGQGVSESWLLHLKAAARRSGALLVVIGERRLGDRAARSSSHKWRRENVLISEPTAFSPTCFECQMVIDEACELLSDHITGFRLVARIGGNSGETGQPGWILLWPYHA